uniref:Uncharacterized protein n=1 Tax=Haptolina ericina TaxID=156174 RepID=A0A7S3BW49_9EUKA
MSKLNRLPLGASRDVESVSVERLGSVSGACMHDADWPQAMGSFLMRQCSPGRSMRHRIHDSHGIQTTIHAPLQASGLRDQHTRLQLVAVACLLISQLDNDLYRLVHIVCPFHSLRHPQPYPS